ncbi:MAG: enoyl-CoA hydratase/isomerase family protein [Proteobacteria bacterium]|nr:enoyl-CoA hydratase/isomerase family protein [Pseudomonadota bacterium]
MSPVKTRIENEIALIEIDNPPVNATSQAVRQGLLDAIKAADEDEGVKAIVIAGAGRTFTAGGDIAEFGKTPLEPHLPDVVNRIEACNKPVVAAWHGTALGGGCEIGLACHARVIAAGSQVGLPEVKLGLVPGAGGTQRLPRLVGIPAALGIATSGRMVGAAEALDLGLVDAVAEDDLRGAAIARARSLIGSPPRRSGELVVPPYDAEAVLKDIAVIEKRARGRIAEGEGARLLLLAADKPLAEGMRTERETFFRLMKSPESEALRYVFFAEREVGKRPDIEPSSARGVQRVGIIGAGTMGAGIAVAFLDAGYDVTVAEAGEEALEIGRTRIAGIYARNVTSGRISEEKKTETLSRATFSTDLGRLHSADLIVEAVFEDMAVKKDLLARLEAVVQPHCILATNTSYLDIDEMAAGLKNPQNVVGLHFFSPANIMKLLEIVRAEKTAPDVLATALAVGRRLRKIAVISGVCDGFIGNRILAKYRAQCEFMLEEGALPQEIDAALEAYGFAMGPFAVQDLAGLDIAWARRKRLAAHRRAEERYVPIADKLCEMGRFGQKTGAGWYRYVEGKRQIDPEINALIKAHAVQSGVVQRPFSADEIVFRVIAAMANEGARILEEKIAARPLDIDIVLLNGYGFPPHKGGPLFAADHLGWDRIVAEMTIAEKRDGKAFSPAALALRLAADKGRVADLNRI